jgi:hypothetical protein
MSETLLLVSKGAFAAAGCCAGVRLAQLARRNAGDGLQGRVSAMILVGGAGLLGFGLGPVLAQYSPALARVLMLLADGLERVALLLLAWFVWRVFGRGHALRRGVLAVVVSILALDWVQMLSAQQWPETRLPVFVDAASQLAFSTPLLWSTVEAWLEYRRSRRQLEHGLTNASVTNRFFLWTSATGCLALVCLTTALAKVVAGAPFWATALEYALALLYWIVAGIVLLGFFPPRFYRRWLDDSASASEAET